MTFDPILTAAPHIQMHILAATLALVLGPVAILRRRRDRLHKVAGYLWVTAMAVTALSSFLIHSFPLIGPFSPIHGLALFTLFSLWQGMRAILRGDVRTHELALRGLYWRGLCLAGLFNFLPGRTMQRALLGESETLGYVIIAVGVALIFANPIRRALSRSLRPVTARFLA